MTIEHGPMHFIFRLLMFYRCPQDVNDKYKDYMSSFDYEMNILESYADGLLEGQTKGEAKGRAEVGFTPFFRRFSEALTKKKSQVRSGGGRSTCDFLIKGIG